ncbi:hypothetical protein BH683_006995 [Williamsia sp. 1138]|uniref:IS3 family transposase n=1 Tax=Gordonia rubripertincta TaxID=36822 RepID=UPI000A0FB449|nr:hypothetical protein BH683_006995 [Williamsia sp. 1138]
MVTDLRQQHPVDGFRRAWAALRFDKHRDVNKKKVHRLWKEEGPVGPHQSSAQACGQASVPFVDADAPKVVWAVDFPFDSTIG